MRFGRCVFSLFLAGWLIAPAAFADPKTLDPAKEAKRTALFEEGRALHLEGKHAEAVSKLKEVVDMRRSPQALRALGLAEQAAGKLLDARAHFEEALKMAQEGGPPGEVEPAKGAAADIAKKIPRLRIVLPKDAEAPSVLVDGAGVKLTNDSVEVDPGPHKVTVQAKDRTPFAQEVQVREGATVDVTVQLDKVPQSTSLRRPIGIGIAAVGGAGVVLGAVTGILAISAHDELAKQCPDALCPKDEQPKLDTYRALGLTSTVAFIAGGALAAAGTVIFLTAPRPLANGRFHASPFVSAQTAGVRFVF